MRAVRQLRAQIASGELAEGDPIPSMRDIMQRWRISMQAASKVIVGLKAEQLAVSTPGGTFVAPGAAIRIIAGPPGSHKPVGRPEFN